VKKYLQKKTKMRALIAILLQLPLIVLTKDVALSESNDRDNSTKIELTTASANLTESTTTLNGNFTISGVDKNSTENTTTTTTTEPPSTTSDPQLQLIPPATVEAQIVKLNISSKKPSRLQAAA
jgi:hypothetical protein